MNSSIKTALSIILACVAIGIVMPFIVNSGSGFLIFIGFCLVVVLATTLAFQIYKTLKGLK